MDENRFSFKEQVIKGSVWHFSSSIIMKIGGLIFTIILARLLLPEKYGIYSLAVSIALIFMVFTDLGTNQAVLRYIPSEMKKGKNKAASYFKFFTKLKITLLVLVSLILFLSSGFISNSIFKNPDLYKPLAISSAYIFLYSFIVFLGSLFFSLKKGQYVVYQESLIQILRIAGLLLVPILFLPQDHVFAVFLVLAIASIIVLIFFFYLLNKNFHFLLTEDKQKIDKKRIFKFISVLGIGGVATVFFGYIDSILIGLFVSNTAYIGFYKSASSIIYSFTGLFLFFRVLVPAFTQLREKDLSFSINRIFRYLMIVAIPSVFGIAILSKYIIVAFFGYEYLPGALPLSLLSIIVISEIGSAIFTSLFVAKEKPKIYVTLLILATILNIILGISLINIFLKLSEEFAIIGLAIATLISSYFLSLFLYSAAKKNFNIQLKKSNFLKPLFASIIMAAFLYFVLNQFPDKNALVIGILILFSMIIYFAILFFIKGITKQDIKDLKFFTLKNKTP